MQPISFSWRIQIRYYSQANLKEIEAMSQNAPLPVDPENGASFAACANCHSPMPKELRFCRNCGYRLGEGSAEYTETTMLQSGGYVAPVGPNAFPGSSRQISNAAACGIGRRKKRFSGISWIFIAVILFFIVGGVASYLAPPFRRASGGFSFTPPRPYVGVSGFKTTDGGVTFDAVEPPGGPADKAGLVGGDIITTIDGHPVFSDREMSGRLAETPIGKTVDVVFIRDGETKMTKLTTISKAEFDQLVTAFRRRPEGQGKLGIDGQEEVEVPGTKLHGVRLGEVDPSMSAALAGLKPGDVVIEFDSAPIRTEGELTSRIHRAMPYSTVPVVVMRGSERLEIPVKIGRRS
jgi:membrane-associated protease RseP (regulator of RpoE activity)